MLSNHIIFCHPLLLLTSIFPSIRVFSSKSSLPIMWPKYWSFSFSIGTSNEYSGLISFRVDWFDFLAVQRDSQKSSPAQLEIIRPSAFSTVQLSRLFMTPGRTIALARWTFVGKVMSLLYNRLSRCVIAFFPRSKCLLISRLQSLPAVILKPKKIKFVTVSTFSSSICHEVMGLEAMISVFWMLSLKLDILLFCFTFKRLCSSSSLYPLKWHNLPIWGCWYFSQQSWF